MTSAKITTCSFCYTAILHNNFKAVDDFTKDVIDIYLQKSKFENDNRNVICTVCYKTLNLALKFKSMCLNNYNRIIAYADCEKMSRLDLNEVYMKENGTAISHDQKVCLLCMQLVQAEFRCIDDEELEAIQKICPKIDTSIVKDPIICTSCFESLYTQNAFLNDCSELQAKVRSICDVADSENQANTQLSNLFIKTENLEDFDRNEMETAHNFLIDCVELKEEVEGISDSSTTESQTAALPSNLFIKSETLNNGPEMNEMEMPIKPEFVGVKLEEDAAESNKFQPSLRYEVNLNSSVETPDEKDLLRQKSLHVRMYKCDKCRYETKNKNRFATHYLRHKDSLKAHKMKNKKSLLIRQARHENLRMYKCDDCDYETKYKQRYMYHYLAHKKVSDVQMMKCNDCSYETRHRTNFLQHILKHKDTSRVRMYKCDRCSYQSRYKSNLTCHQLRHKSRLETCLYKCDICNYETKYKTNLISHQITHKSSAENQMYQCDQCDYRVKYKSTLNDHKLKHKDPSQIQMYKCNDCVFETMYRRNLMAHVLRHRSLIEDPKYKCKSCEYTTGKKIYLLRHQLKHKNSVEARMYKCNVCSYETKYRDNFTKHQLEHKKLTNGLRNTDSAEAQMYKCNDCDFETKYKTSITSHVIRHKNISQEGKYKCDDCNYSTMIGGNFQRHRLKHKNPSEIRMYKCEACCFETKYKRSLANHQLTHKNSLRERKHNCEKCAYKNNLICQLKQEDQMYASDDKDLEVNKNNVMSDVLRVTITQKIRAILNVVK